MEKNQIAIYQPDHSMKLEVRMEEETVWLSQKLMAALFDCSTDNVSLHLKNIFKENELEEISVAEDFSVTASDGKNYRVKHYNLDAIIAVGYRVNSKRATAFRQWATSVLKDYLIKGYAVNQRFERLEYRMFENETKIDFFVKAALPPIEGIFYDGQVFDAYAFVSDLIKSAKKSIVLIDNYVDESALLLLSKRKAGVTATLYTATISPQLQLDLQRHNAQYQPVTVHLFDRSHDRFLLIDDDTYHIGASLKDLGKKWFAFSKIGLRPNGVNP
ncbi:MAG: virulence RhuM family protein [Bacteroidales bacterium]|nr:virulence RhuM family protein [Bacteroidales bacterium]